MFALQISYKLRTTYHEHEQQQHQQKQHALVLVASSNDRVESVFNIGAPGLSVRDMTFVSEEGRTGLFTHSVGDRRARGGVRFDTKGGLTTGTELAAVVVGQLLSEPGRVGGVSTPPLLLPEVNLAFSLRGKPDGGFRARKGLGFGEGKKPPRLFTMVVAVLPPPEKKLWLSKKFSCDTEEGGFLAREVLLREVVVPAGVVTLGFAGCHGDVQEPEGAVEGLAEVYTQLLKERWSAVVRQCTPPADAVLERLSLMKRTRYLYNKPQQQRIAYAVSQSKPSFRTGFM